MLLFCSPYHLLLSYCIEKAYININILFFVYSALAHMTNLAHKVKASIYEKKLKKEQLT